MNKAPVAVEKFLGYTKASVDLIEKINERIEDHMGLGPDDITWNNVGDIDHVFETLVELAEFLGVEYEEE